MNTGKPDNVWPARTDNGKLAVLAAIYDLWDKWWDDSCFSCGPGCASCCTRGVLATTIESQYLSHTCPDTTRRVLSTITSPAAFNAPLLTTNGFAELCLAGRQEPQDPYVQDLLPCYFLDSKGMCSVYDGRPLACRIMASQKPCSGHASTPDYHVSMATVFMQAVEHLDSGWWGSIWTLLAMQVGNDRQYHPALRRCRKIPGFLIAGEEKVLLSPVMEQLLRLLPDKQVT